MEISKLNKSWYRHWWSIFIVLPILPLFTLWYVWTELERSKLFRLSASIAILALCAGVISVAYALPGPTKPNLTHSKPASTNIAVSLPISPTVRNNSQTTTSKSVTAPSSVTQSTAKPSPITTSKSTSLATSTTPTPVTQTPTSMPPLTLEQQYPNTYPANWANAPIDSVIDTWGMDNRESVSYTAWKVNETFGNMPYGWGNASQWPSNAQRAGILSGTIPKLHSVAIVPAYTHGTSSSGFSAWVEAINGNQVTVSSYNWGNAGNYSVSIEPSSYFSTYIYFSGN
ncbi:MAG: CHAP domain-containing protein [Candidatus Saccharimonadales bacterium]